MADRRGEFGGAISLLTATAKAAADALHGTAKFASKHRPTIEAATRSALDKTGEAVGAAGGAIASKAASIARVMRDPDPAENSQAVNFLRRAGGHAADSVGAFGRLSDRVNAFSHRASPAIAAATSNAVSGIVGAVSGAVDSVSITDGHFEALHERLRLASAAVKSEAAYNSALITRAQREHGKKELLDVLVIGGVTLSTLAQDPSQTPANVESAFAIAYPNLAAGGETFADAVHRLPAEDLVGLVNGVKGKLFEAELVDDLNSGGLPDGMQAELAGSVTQPGYDIRIFDEDGRTVDVLQAKATESVAYVQEALERYPDIDVTTTTEVYAQLTALGAVDGVSDSGLSEHALQATVESAVASDDLGASDVVPSSVGLAVIALSTFRDGSLTAEERGGEFGDRAAKAGVAGIAAHAAFISTGAWWLAVVVGMGSRWLTSYGGSKRQRYEALEQIVEYLERKAQKSADQRAVREPPPYTLLCSQ